MANVSEPFPWRDAMRFGFGVLRLSPQAFWSLSIRELQAAMEAHGVAQAEVIQRQTFQEIMQQHPDCAMGERFGNERGAAAPVKLQKED